MGVMLVCMERICNILLAGHVMDGNIPLRRVPAKENIQPITDPFLRSLVLFLELSYEYQITEHVVHGNGSMEYHILQNKKETSIHKLAVFHIFTDSNSCQVEFVDGDTQPLKEIQFTKYKGPETKGESSTIFDISDERQRKILLLMFKVVLEGKPKLLDTLESSIQDITDFKSYTDEVDSTEKHHTRFNDDGNDIDLFFQNIRTFG